MSTPSSLHSAMSDGGTERLGLLHTNATSPCDTYNSLLPWDGLLWHVPADCLDAIPPSCLSCCVLAADTSKWGTPQVTSQSIPSNYRANAKVTHLHAGVNTFVRSALFLSVMQSRHNRGCERQADSCNTGRDNITRVFSLSCFWLAAVTWCVTPACMHAALSKTTAPKWHVQIYNTNKRLRLIRNVSLRNCLIKSRVPQQTTGDI